LLQYEHEQRLQLENMVEQLGKQHSNLEKQIRKSMNGAIDEQIEGELSSVFVLNELCVLNQSVYCLLSDLILSPVFVLK